MKKTFRKALACLLAVLMVVFSVPFSALAYSTTVGEANYKWWNDSDLPLTEVPEYTPYNAKTAFGNEVKGSALKSATNSKKRWNMKPVIAATVSSMGTADNTLEEMDAYQENFYGNVNYATAEEAGVILNPTDLKAGQRIAVTYEVGGLDVMNNGQIVSSYDTSKITPSGYYDLCVDNDEDTWIPDVDCAKFSKSNAAFTPAANIDDMGEAKVAFVATAAMSTASSSNYIGNNTEGYKYGVVCCTFFFEVLEDCDLTQVITFKEGRDGTVFEWANIEAGLADGLIAITLSEEADTCILFAPPIWTNATSAPTPETHEHNYTSEVTKAATCTEDGVKTFTCTSTTGTCDKPSYTEVIPATGHKSVDVPAQDPTCTEPGVTAGTKCSVCGATIDAGSEIPALNHNYTSEITTEATCTKAGVRTYTCTREGCNDSYTEAIPATGHDVQTVTGKAATCTEAGLTDGKACTKCDYVEVAQEEIPALDHDFSVLVSSTAADCQTIGTTTYKCSRCEETNVVKGGYGPHGEGVEDEGVVTTEPSCTTLGVKTFTTKCPICNEVLSTRTEDIAMTAHQGVEDEGVVTTEPSCTAPGVKTFTTKCSECNEVLSTRTEDIAMTAHQGVEDEGVVTTEPSCTTLGVKTFTTKCSECNEVLSTRTEEIAMTAHVAGAPEVTTVDATVDAEGSVTTIVKCENCGTELSKDVQVLPMLKGYTVTVDATDMGYVTLNGADVTDGAAVKVAAESKVTLTATPVEGATFVGWTANGLTTISTDTEFTTTVLANVTYTPVFEIATEDVFTVTFVDAYGNVVSVCTSDNGITVPTAPARPGYVAATENGWSMTNDEIAALTASATITAQYVKAEETTYTVKAAGCEITANGETIADEISVPFDTKVTVTNTSATAWIVKDAKTGEEVKVAYGDSYTFFVTADIELTFDTEAVVATPQVANVGVSSVGTAPRIQAMFKATRTMADGCQYIDSGFVYGKGDLGAITLDDVDGKAVKAVYNKTASEQFSLTYGLSAQQGTITAVAFLAYVDAAGVNHVAYAAPMTFTY